MIFSDNKLSKNIVLFYRAITEESLYNPTYLHFFRTICKFKQKGLSVNQEIIFKFRRDSRKFNNSLFMKINM